MPPTQILHNLLPNRGEERGRGCEALGGCGRGAFYEEEDLFGGVVGALLADDEGVGDVRF